MFLCTIIFAQEIKPCLFIGTFEKNKRGIDALLLICNSYYKLDLKFKCE